MCKRAVIFFEVMNEGLSACRESFILKYKLPDNNMKNLFIFCCLIFAFNSHSQIVVEPITVQHPHIFMTQADVDLMKTRVANQQQPWYQSWQNVSAKAEADMSKQPVPYTGLEAYLFYDKCTVDSERALNLAIAYQINPKRQYALGALNTLYQWAAQTTATVPDIYTYDATNGYNVNTSMLFARSTIQFVFVYDLLHNHFAEVNFTPAMIQTVENWFSLLAVRVEQGIWTWHNNDYFNKQEYQNHLVAHKMGLIAYGYALHDRDMVQYAIDSDANPRDLVELMAGVIFMAGDAPCVRELPHNPPPTQTGEIYDRYRHFTAPDKGLQYAHLTLTLLTVCAEMTKNNGLDFFQYTAPTGENLELAFDFYSSFYWLKDARLRGGMYGSENHRIALGGDTRAIFELGHSNYPDNRNINKVLEVSNRTDISSTNSDGRMWLMGSPVLTHGTELLPEPINTGLGLWDMTSTVVTEQEGKQKVSIAGGAGKFIVLGRTEQYGGDNPLYLPVLQNVAGNNVLHFDGSDSAYIPSLRNNYGDFVINFKLVPDDISTDQTILYTTGLFDVRLVPNAENTAACIQFIVYPPEGGVEIASSPYSIIAGTTYQVNLWRQSDIAAVYVNGQTDVFGYAPFDMITDDANLYLGTIYKFDRRFFKGSIDDLEISCSRYDYICGDWGFATADVNKDCYVDIRDFALLASQWLDCTNELVAGCSPAGN